MKEILEINVVKNDKLIYKINSYNGIKVDSINNFKVELLPKIEEKRILENESKAFFDKDLIPFTVSNIFINYKSK